MELPAEAAETTGDPLRGRILSAARLRFFSVGFASCTMDQLASELGISKKTLYQRFRSKEELIERLLRLKANAIKSGFEAILEAGDLSFAQRAHRMLRHAFTELSEVSVAFLHDLRRFQPATHARLDEFRSRVAPVIWERLFRLGMEAGAVRADADPVFLGRLIPVAMQALLQPETLQRFQLQPHEMMPRFFQLMFSGVLTPDGRSEYEKTTFTNGVPSERP